MRGVTKMKTSFVFILALSYVSAFSQTIKSIDSVIYRINHTRFTDSITILDTTNRMKKPVRITGYLSGDTVFWSRKIVKSR